MCAAVAIGRSDLEKLYNAGLKTAQFSFLSDLLEQWLEKYPNDIECRYKVAQISHLQTNDKSAGQILEDILISDPEFVPAYELLGRFKQRREQEGDKFRFTRSYRKNRGHQRDIPLGGHPARGPPGNSKERIRAQRKAAAQYHRHRTAKPAGSH